MSSRPDGRELPPRPVAGRVHPQAAAVAAVRVAVAVPASLGEHSQLQIGLPLVAVARHDPGPVVVAAAAAVEPRPQHQPEDRRPDRIAGSHVGTGRKVQVKGLALVFARR
jgi:hypothetical protein